MVAHRSGIRNLTLEVFRIYEDDVTVNDPMQSVPLQKTIWKVNYDSSWEGKNYIFRGTVILEYFNK